MNVEANDRWINKPKHTECATCKNSFCLRFSRSNRLAGRQYRVLSRGDRVESQDRKRHRFWSVLDGAVAVCANLYDGRRQIVEVQMPGDVVHLPGDVDGAEWAIEALAGTKLCELTMADAEESQPFDMELMKTMLEFDKSKLARLAVHTVGLGRLDGTERICQFLADMARRQGQGREIDVAVNLPMSRDDIADYLGLKAETVSRLLGRIRRAKLAIFDSPTKCRVPSIQALEEHARIYLPSPAVVATA